MKTFPLYGFNRHDKRTPFRLIKARLSLIQVNELQKLIFNININNYILYHPCSVHTYCLSLTTTKNVIKTKPDFNPTCLFLSIFNQRSMLNTLIKIMPKSLQKRPRQNLHHHFDYEKKNYRERFCCLFTHESDEKPIVNDVVSQLLLPKEK